MFTNFQDAPLDPRTTRHLELQRRVLTRQRDALLAALQAILDPATKGYRASDELLSRARAAIASCEAGTAKQDAACKEG